MYIRAHVFSNKLVCGIIILILVVSPEDYLSASGILKFNTGDTRQCHNVEIIDDDVCKSEVEQFIFNLALVSGATVTVDPPSARVIIFDGTNDCVCKWLVEWNPLVLTVHCHPYILQQ